MASSADFWYVWIIVVAVVLVGSKWCYYQRQRHIVRQQLLNHSSVPTALQLQQRQAVQMIDISALPPGPAGYTAVWVDGQLVFQPLYSPAASAQQVDPPPAYQQYPPGVAAVPVQYQPNYSASVHYSAAQPSYRLSDKAGTEPIPSHLRPGGMTVVALQPASDVSAASVAPVAAAASQSNEQPGADSMTSTQFHSTTGETS